MYIMIRVHVHSHSYSGFHTRFFVFRTINQCETHSFRGLWVILICYHDSAVNQNYRNIWGAGCEDLNVPAQVMKPQ